MAFEVNFDGVATTGDGKRRQRQWQTHTEKCMHEMVIAAIAASEEDRSGDSTQAAAVQAENAFMRLQIAGEGGGHVSTRLKYYRAIGRNAAFKRMKRRGLTQTQTYDIRQTTSERMELPQPEEAAEQRDAVSRLQTAMRNLGEFERQVVTMRILEGMTRESIAQKIERTVETVRWAEQCAMESLRNGMK